MANKRSMVKKRSDRTRNKKFNKNQEKMPIPLPSQPSFDIDVNLIESLAPSYDTIISELKKTFERLDAKEKPFPTESDLLKAEKSIRSKRRSLQKEFSILKGSQVTSQEMDELLKEGLHRFRNSAKSAFSGKVDLAPLVLWNLQAEGTYQIVGSNLQFTPPSGHPVYFSQALDTGTILSVSIAIEVAGLIIGLIGIAIPKVPIDKIAGALEGKFGSEAVKKSLQALVELLKGGQQKIADIFEAIIKFIKALADAGALSDIIAKMFGDYTWWQIALLVIQLLAQIALWLIPGGAATLIARQAIAIISAIASLTKKAFDLSKVI